MTIVDQLKVYQHGLLHHAIRRILEHNVVGPEVAVAARVDRRVHAVHKLVQLGGGRYVEKFADTVAVLGRLALQLEDFGDSFAGGGQQLLVDEARRSLLGVEALFHVVGGPGALAKLSCFC